MTVNVLAYSPSQQKTRRLSTYSFRQAPARPLQHYIERESALIATETNVVVTDSTGQDLVSTFSVAVDNGFVPDATGQVCTEAALIPVTELRSPVVFNSTQSITRQLVSVRRGWGNRLVNRLAARSSKAFDMDLAVDSTDVTVSENVSVKGVPFLLNTVDKSERIPNN